jgi:hypothetical protein
MKLCDLQLTRSRSPRCAYIPFLDFLPLMEIGPPPAVASWSQRLLARPSAVATRPEK